MSHVNCILWQVESLPGKVTIFACSSLFHLLPSRLWEEASLLVLPQSAQICVHNLLSIINSPSSPSPPEPFTAPTQKYAQMFPVTKPTCCNLTSISKYVCSSLTTVSHQFWKSLLTKALCYDCLGKNFISDAMCAIAGRIWKLQWDQ